MTKEDKKGIILIVVAVVVATVIGVVAYQKNKNKTYFNKQTLCPINKSYDNRVVIIDKSDKWSYSDSDRIVRLINRTQKDLKLYERLTIKVIEPDSNKTKIVTYFDLCNPGNKANPLYENPRRILKKYKDSFEKPLKLLQKTLAKPEVSKSTPLLKVIRDELLEEKNNLKLIVVSDFMEYSNEYNFYRNIPNVREIIDTFPKNSLNQFDARYIMRLSVKDKIYKSLDFFKKLTNSLGGVFKKREIMVINDKRRYISPPKPKTKPTSIKVAKNNIIKKNQKPKVKKTKYKPIKSKPIKITKNKPIKKEKIKKVKKKQQPQIYYCKASSQRASGWAKKVGLERAKNIALSECEKRRISEIPCEIVECYEVK